MPAVASPVSGSPRVPRGRLIVVALLIVAGVLLVRALGLHHGLRLENLARLKAWMQSHGALAPVLFMSGYAVAELFFVPALPLTILGGIAFGPIWGTAYVSIGATIGAALAFLAARYAMRGAAERWIVRSPRLTRLDAAVAEHGWRVLMFTRLVPLFPFNLQNFVYGLTAIRFWPFVLLTWVCILPGTAAFTFAGNALVEGAGDLRRTLAYLGAAGVVIVAASLLPRLLARRSRMADNLVDTERAGDG